MSVTAASYPPVAFTAGDTVTWEQSHSGYSATDGWAVIYYLRGTVKYTLPTAVGVGETHTTTVPASTSAAYTAGDYWLFGYAVNAGTGERVQIYSGECTIHPDHSTATAAYDGRSHARIALDAVEAAIEGRATREEQSYMLSAGGINRQVSFCTISELAIARSFYSAEVRREEDAARIAAGKKSRNKILTRFIA